MGRAIVRNPSVFLMDEPLSNLDAKLRVQMRTEISRIQQRLETTTIYVTHDQTEAMTLGDRIAVMRAGRAAAGRSALRAVRLSQEPVRRRVHRLALDELPGRRDRRRQRQPADRRRCRSPTSCAGALESGSGGGRKRRDRRTASRAFRGRRAGRATALAGSRSRPRSTCSSRWARSSTRISSSSLSASSSTELEELAQDAGSADLPARGTASRSRPGWEPTARRARAPRQSCGSTRATCSCSTPSPARVCWRSRPARRQRRRADADAASQRRFHAKLT